MTSFKYVVCIDGTWNSPGAVDKDPITQEEAACPTNVERMWNALSGRALDNKVCYGRICDLKNEPGEAAYFDGVGSAGTVLDKCFEGSTGTGTSERIRDAYRFLAERWDSGDEIHIFGFSRGAFAARSLAGFLNRVGLPAERSMLDDAAIAKLYEPYRTRTPGPLPEGHVPAAVTFVGVWDTVGALAFGKGFNNFHETSPGNVERVAHALALDERREAFGPTFWGPKTGQTKFVREVWFPGVHSNVGGGYADAKLSDITLSWMIQQAKAAGLSFDASAIARVDSAAAFGEIRDSYKEFMGKFSVVGGLLAKVNWEAVPRTILDGQSIHEAVRERMEHDAGSPYVPAARLPGKLPLTPAVVSAREEPWQKLDG
ncbi:DUF2235 domain-containing protein [Azospirillum sp. sgz301742]